MALPAGGGVSIPPAYRRELRAATSEAGIPLEVGAAQIQTESGWDPNAVSSAGAEGIAQFEPGTWRQYGDGGDPFNPRDAFPAYGRFMNALMSEESGSLRNALAAYNAGPGNIGAGLGYADTILGKAGMRHGGSGNPTPDVPYANPFRDVKNLQPERIDMGVDYSGTGPVYAPGPGVITEADNAWAGGVGDVGPGTFIAEKLKAGPLAGKVVYFAENISPSVTAGQRVDTSTVLGDMSGGIETGFAAGPSGGTTLAMATGQASASGDPGASTTAYGRAWSDVLHFLGAPSGLQGGPDSGALPAGWWTGGGNLAPGGAGGGAGGLLGIDIGGIGGAIGTIADSISKIEHAVEWFLLPSHWVRIFAGLGGAGLVAYGIVSLGRPRVNLPMLGSTPVVPGGELGPALGIGSVTAGAVLLFVAFHNLPNDITSFGSFLSYLQQQAKGGGRAS